MSTLRTTQQGHVQLGTRMHLQCINITTWACTVRNMNKDTSTKTIYGHVQLGKRMNKDTSTKGIKCFLNICSAHVRDQKIPKKQYPLQVKWMFPNLSLNSNSKLGCACPYNFNSHQ